MSLHGTSGVNSGRFGPADGPERTPQWMARLRARDSREWGTMVPIESCVLAERDTSVTDPGTHFMWLEITGKCQLSCAHCYASSGPSGNRGVMTTDRWLSVIRQASAAGVTSIQFIGGEPTSHPNLPLFITEALACGLAVEVFSNLFYIPEPLWDTLCDPGVRLATSYYSATPEIHDRITGITGSHVRTRRNIGEACRRGIDVRVGLIEIGDEQDVAEATRDLVIIGVPADQIGFDSLRRVGRGESAYAGTLRLMRREEPESQLCGKCANGVLAILPSGEVKPCVFCRDDKFTVGNVMVGALASVLAGSELADMRTLLTDSFERRSTTMQCPPHGPSCPPQCLPQCWPGCPPNCAPSCGPSCIPMGNCRPVVGPPY